MRTSSGEPSCQHRPPPGPPPPGWVPPGRDRRPARLRSARATVPPARRTGAPPVHKPGVVALRPLALGDFFDGAFKTIRRNPGDGRAGRAGHHRRSWWCRSWSRLALAALGPRLTTVDLGAGGGFRRDVERSAPGYAVPTCWARSSGCSRRWCSTACWSRWSPRRCSAGHHDRAGVDGDPRAAAAAGRADAARPAGRRCCCSAVPVLVGGARRRSRPASGPGFGVGVPLLLAGLVGLVLRAVPVLPAGRRRRWCWSAPGCSPRCAGPAAQPRAVLAAVRHPRC